MKKGAFNAPLYGYKYDYISSSLSEFRYSALNFSSLKDRILTPCI